MPDLVVLTDEQLEQVEKLAGLGLRQDQIAAMLNVHRATYQRLINRDERVKAAVEKGKAKAATAVTKSAFKQAISGKNTAMTIFWLKVREGWKEDVYDDQVDDPWEDQPSLREDPEEES